MDLFILEHTPEAFHRGVVIVAGQTGNACADDRCPNFSLFR
jgi:hypothetical protein